jgi:hypothetical protein
VDDVNIDFHLYYFILSYDDRSFNISEILATSIIRAMNELRKHMVEAGFFMTYTIHQSLKAGTLF